MEDESFAIEKDVPLPPRVGSVARRYPFRQMDVGDSFLIPSGTKSKRGKPMVLAGVASTASRFAREMSEETGGTVRFACREVPEGIRVWRIK